MYVIKSFNDPTAFQDYLNGSVLGAPLPTKVNGLHNKTLIIKAGSSTITVTFADAAGLGLLPSEVLAQINAADAKLVGALLFRDYGYTNPKNPTLALVAIGYKLMGAGTANPYLGFPAVDTDVSEIDEESIVASYINPTGPLYQVVVHTN